MVTSMYRFSKKNKNLDEQLAEQIQPHNCSTFVMLELKTLSTPCRNIRGACYVTQGSGTQGTIIITLFNHRSTQINPYTVQCAVTFIKIWITWTPNGARQGISCRLQWRCSMLGSPGVTSDGQQGAIGWSAITFTMTLLHAKDEVSFSFL